MSFIAYLCWLLGITVSGDCDSTTYSNFMEACEVDDAVDANLPKDGEERNVPPHHGRSTNIDLSI